MARFGPRLLILLSGLFLLGADGALRPPVAAKKPKPIVQHGERRVDDYFWLRERENPEVIAYLKAENAYTGATLKPLAGLTEALYQEALGRLKQDDDQPAYPKGGYLYYSRYEKGKQYAILCRRRGEDGAEQVVLDHNQLAAGRPYFSMDEYEVSDDGNLLVYSIDTTGAREYTLRVRDLRTGRDLGDRIDNVTSAAWAGDNRTLLYAIEDDAKRAYRLYRHVLGEGEDELVYEEKDRLFGLHVSRTRSRAYIRLECESATTSEVRMIPADRPAAAPSVVEPRREGHEYYADHRGGEFFIWSNDKGRNFRLVRAPVEKPGMENWREVIPHRDDVMLERVDCFAGHCALYERAEGLPRLRVMDFQTGQVSQVQAPEAVYQLWAEQNHEFESGVVRYRYVSFTTPWSVYAYDVKEGRSKLLKRTEVLGGYDPSRYESERIHATAADGARIPISLVRRRGAKAGPKPLLLSAYGAYGISHPVTFRHSLPSLLDRGVTLAVAHVRGGGELGKRWHDEGRMMTKKNTFTDVVACAEYLIAEGYTSSDRLAVRGGSAGGLTVGAALNLRPELFRAAVLEVPFVDVLNTMSDDSIPLTTQEHIEWGDPNVKGEYEYIRSYCPYTNLSSNAYPAIFVRTSLNDSQVPYWEAAKYVAKLRGLKTDANPLLLRVNLEAGHGGASGRYDHMREDAVVNAFILNELGIAHQAGSEAGSRSLLLPLVGATGGEGGNERGA
jgi:oligopeptidase B